MIGLQSKAEEVMSNNKVVANLTVSIGGYSTAGKREVNQDAFAVKDPSSALEKNTKGIVACIADGVSCSDNGQQASHTSVTQFISDYYSTDKNWNVKQSAGKILNSLNAWLYQHNQSDLRHNGLITTFSSLILKSNTAHLFHAGDSRIYRFREHKLNQLTLDHSRITYNQNSFLTRALGMDCHIDIDYLTTTLQINDLFMLTTDGVHDYLDKNILNTYLDTLPEHPSTESLENLSKQICDDALAQKSSDNISCLLIYVSSLPKADLSELFAHLNNLIIPPAMGAGNEIDCFKIKKVLHEGPRSHVYLASYKETQELVVLKMPSLNFEEDLDYLSGFYKEQWVGQSIKNPHIMSIADNVKGSVFLYHICEYVEGITLRQWIRENPQPEFKKTCSIIANIVSAVRVLQRAGMVHRDLKPENIIITKGDQIKLIDFGTVKVNGFEEIVKEQEVTPLGALDYIAPEYLNEGKSSALSDLFSIAVIAYELLTGDLPYPDNQAQSLDRARQYSWEYVSIKTHRTDLSKRIDNIFKKALHPQLDKRYSSMGEFISDLMQSQKQPALETSKQALLERDPTKFWRGLAIIFIGISVIESIALINS